MENIYHGNAEQDGTERRGWIVGSFIPEGIRHQENVEIKYGSHTAGESRDEWVTGETRTTVCMLISGKFALQFQDSQAELNKPGDYVMWGPGVDHKWQVLEDAVVLTIRWSD